MTRKASRSEPCCGSPNSVAGRYAIIKETERLSGGDVRLPVGTLYGALERLLNEGLVSVDGEEIIEGRAALSPGLAGLASSGASRSR